MVRLKEILHPVKCYQIAYFNSSMVRLKVIYMAVLPVYEMNFNSSMVRLKELEFGGHVRINDGFQFLNGAIKRKLCLIKVNY